MKAGQLGLPGVRPASTARVRRTAGGPTTSTRGRPAYTSPSGLPLGWQTRVDPADVLVNVAVAGEPRPKGRPRHTQAHVNDRTGQLVQGHTYTPPATAEAEEAWRWVMRAARVGREPVAHPVGVLLFFKTASSRASDVDNLTKMVLDSGNGVLWVDDQQVVEVHAHLLRRCTEPGTELLAWLTGRRRPGES